MAPVPASATTLRFETTDGIVPTDNGVVLNQYTGSPFGVSFRRGTGTDYANYVDGPFWEATGPGSVSGDTTGLAPYFTNNPYPADESATPPLTNLVGFNHNPEAGNIYNLNTDGRSDLVSGALPAASQDGLTRDQRATILGDFFLRTSPFSATDRLTVQFDFPVTICTFEVWDLDGNTGGTPRGEQYFVDAFNGDWTTVLFTESTPFVGGATGPLPPSGLLGNDDATSYDGQRLLVTVDNGGQPFDRFVIRPGEGTFTDGSFSQEYKTTAVGIAFNNLDYQNVLAVDLTAFSATAASASSPVSVEWTTAAELDSAGFYVESSATAAGPWTRVNADLVAAQGSASAGASYQVIDATPLGNAVRWYRLVEVELDGSANVYSATDAVVAPTASSVAGWTMY